MGKLLSEWEGRTFLLSFSFCKYAVYFDLTTTIYSVYDILVLKILLLYCAEQGGLN